MAAYQGPSGKRLAFPGPDTRAWGNQVEPAVGSGALTLAAPTLAGAGVGTAPIAPAAGTGAVSVPVPSLLGTGAAGAASAFFPFDTTAIANAQSSWHSDPIIRTPAGVVFGYSKQGSTFGLMLLSPTTGALIDARVILNEPTLYTGIINDHFMVVPKYLTAGAYSGSLWASTLPHGPAAVGLGQRGFWQRWSATGLPDGLVPSNLDGFDVRDGVATHNYGHTFQRSDGRFGFVTINDGGSPQSARMAWTNDPRQRVTLGRPIFNMSGDSFTANASAQLYVNAVPGLTADTMVCYGFLHPLVPDAPIKRFVIDLNTGQVLANGAAQGSGSIWDASGAAMLTFGAAPAINAPTGSLSTRLTDVCQYGTYAGGFAVVGAQGPSAATVSSYTFFIRWCNPAQNPDVAANWQQAQVGTTQARQWLTSSRYMSDIKFLPPRGSEAVRVVLIAFDAVQGYRLEVWAGSAPNTMALVQASPWAGTDPRPMRIYANPGAATDPLLAVVTSFTGTMSGFTNFTPGPLFMLINNPAPGPAAGTGSITLAPATVAGSGAGAVPFSFASMGDVLTVDPATNTVVDTGGVSQITSTGTTSVWSQATSANRPDLVAGPPARLDFVHTAQDALTGDAAARAFTQNRKAVMVLMRIAMDAAIPSENRFALNISNGVGAGTQRLGVRQAATSGAIQSIGRTGTESASLATGPAVTAGQRYVVAVVLTARVAGDGGSTHRLYVDGTAYTPAAEPANASAIQNAASAEVQLGRVGTNVTPWDGQIGPVVMIANSSREFTPGEIADAIALYETTYPNW